ncbi:hypothetical protein EVAR_100360_1 [Eumeta japonica]|uniref:Uncharacterized protein n=1 Tax=Eumeta variegata TaxID=151549 RepID=A0A4C2A974_EUMVA|nr:hypothetical protein EVAR_100360_1 [Eumeta japonica]
MNDFQGLMMEPKDVNYKVGYNMLIRYGVPASIIRFQRQTMKIAMVKVHFETIPTGSNLPRIRFYYGILMLPSSHPESPLAVWLPVDIAFACAHNTCTDTAAVELPASRRRLLGVRWQLCVVLEIVHSLGTGHRGTHA